MTDLPQRDQVMALVAEAVGAAERASGVPAR